jgi:RNA polymerase sigma-70 factor (ECF subfamily)
MGSDSFARQVLAHLPKLIGYSRKIATSRSAADDLVQETILRALLHADQFTAGSSLDAWLTVILRNCHINEVRRRGRLEHLDAQNDRRAISEPQHSHMLLRELERQMANLPSNQRKALVLVALNGESYEQAAGEAGCAIGTIKSRVWRARCSLLELNRSAITKTLPETGEGAR